MDFLLSLLHPVSASPFITIKSGPVENYEHALLDILTAAARKI